MHALICKIFALLKDYWNLWGSIIISLLWAWWKKFSIVKMDETTSFLTMTLMFVGVSTFVKSMIIKKNHKKNNSNLDNVFQNQRSVKTISIALDPIGECEKLGKLVLTTAEGGKKIMNKIKRFFKWIGLYWQQLVGLLGSIAYALVIVYAYIFDKFGFILQYFPQTIGWEIAVKVCIGILSLVFVIFIIRNQVTGKSFIGSIETAETYLKNMSTQLSTNLSSSVKSKIKDALKQVKKQTTAFQKQLESIEKQITQKSKEIEDIEEFIKLGLSTGSTQDNYNNLLTAKNDLQKQYDDLKLTIEKKLQEIAKYESVL